MKKRAHHTTACSEWRGFWVRVGALLALMALVGWAGWFAPWSRASTQVVVEAVDAPHAP